MITAQQAYDDLRNYKKDISDIDFDVFMSWINYINNFIYRAYIGSCPTQINKVYSFTSSPNVSNYTLPTDFRSINTWGTGLYLSDDLSQIDKSLAITMPGSQLPGFYVTNTDIVLTPKPVDSQTYYFWYIPKLTKLTAMADETIIEDEYLELLTKALDVKYTQWDNGKGDEGFADARFVRCLNELLDNVLYTPAVYSFPN